jgi:preprotein translocase subunit SecD
MKVYTSRFNLFFVLTILLVPLCGCALFGKKDEPVAAMRIHMEAAPDSGATGNPVQTVTVLRAAPVQVTIDKSPILTEANLVAAKVISTPDAPAIEVRFDENGTWILEQYSAANPGRHFVINGQWGKKLKEGRWIAAPVIAHRIKDGILSFTPDMSKDEADQFVQGLNNVAKQFQTKSQE